MKMAYLKVNCYCVDNSITADKCHAAASPLKSDSKFLTFSFGLTQRQFSFILGTHSLLIRDRPIFFRSFTSASSVGPSEERMRTFWYLISATAVILLHPVATQTPQQPGATAASLIELTFYFYHISWAWQVFLIAYICSFLHYKIIASIKGCVGKALKLNFPSNQRSGKVWVGKRSAKSLSSTPFCAQRRTHCRIQLPLCYPPHGVYLVAQNNLALFLFALPSLLWN